MQTIVRLVSSGLSMTRIPALRRPLGRTGVVSRRPRESGASSDIAMAARAAQTHRAQQRFVSAVPEASRPG